VSSLKDGDSWWLAATDEYMEGTFKWSYPDVDQTLYYSFPFAPDEPDNAGKYGADCLKLTRIGERLLLQDGDCRFDNSSGFVCEENLQPVKEVKSTSYVLFYTQYF